MLLLFLADMLSSERLESIISEHLQGMECFLQDLPELRQRVAGNKGQEFLLKYVENNVRNEKKFLEEHSEEFMESLKTEVTEMETNYE